MIQGSQPPASPAELFKRLAGIQEALILVIQPPPVSGIGNAGGVPDDGRGPRRPRLAGIAGSDHRDGRQARRQTPGLTQVFTLFENSTPEIYLDIDRTKAQLLGINVADVFAALQVYVGSAYVNDFNLLGRTFRVTAQADAPYRRRSRGYSEDPRAQFEGRNCAARFLHDGPRHCRPVSGAALQSLSRGGTRRHVCPGLLTRTSHRGLGQDRCRDAARRVRIRVDDARIPADPSGQHRPIRVRTRSGVRLPRARGTIRKPHASASRGPDRADVSRRLDQSG